MTQIIPWSTHELRRLKLKKIKIKKWIMALEEENVGRLLAMKDLKAPLVKVVGTTKCQIKMM